MCRGAHKSTTTVTHKDVALMWGWLWGLWWEVGWGEWCVRSGQHRRRCSKLGEKAIF